MRDALTASGLASGDVALEFYTAPSETAPASIEGTHDSVVSCAAVLKDLEGRWSEWDGVSLQFQANVAGLRRSPAKRLSIRPPHLLHFRLAMATGRPGPCVITQRRG